MKQLFCVVFAFVIAFSLAACTSENNDATTIATTTSSNALQTTTSPTQDVVTTTAVQIATTTTDIITTTVHSSQSSTDTSADVTTTTAVTTTTNKTDLPNGISYYFQYPNVPDYGALVGVDYSKFENNIFYYRMDLVAQKDPNGNSGSLYMQLLEDCGYVALAPYDKNGVKGYLYGNSTTGAMVLFGAAPEKGAIVVAIPQQ